VFLDVSNDSLQTSRTLEETQVAVYNAPRAPDTSADNLITAKQRLKAFDMKSAAERKAFESRAGLAHVKSVLKRELKPHVMKDISSGSDLIGAVNASVPYIDSWPEHSPKVLVILSDMQYRAEGVDLQKTPLSPAKVRKALKRERAQGRLPELGPGCEVYLSGARASLGTKQYQSIKRFWTSYFELTGANVRFYGNRLPKLVMSRSASVAPEEGR